MENLLTVRQVAERLNMSMQGVRNLCKDGKLTYLDLDRTWRIAEADLNAYLAARHAEAVARAEERRKLARGVGR